MLSVNRRLRAAELDGNRRYGAGKESAKPAAPTLLSILLAGAMQPPERRLTASLGAVGLGTCAVRLWSVLCFVVVGSV